MSDEVHEGIHRLSLTDLRVRYPIRLGEKSYRLEMNRSGIFLIEADNTGQEIERLRLPSVATKLDLVYALLDGMVNRFLSHDFCWEHDTYASALRIALALLVPRLNTEIYPTVFGTYTQPVVEFDVEHFNTLKRILDTQGNRYITKQKNQLLVGIPEGADEAYLLTDYASDDSEEGEEESPEPAISDELDVLRAQAGFTKFMKYLKGEVKTIPSNTHDIPPVELPSKLSQEINSQLVRDVQSLSLSETTRSDAGDTGAEATKSADFLAAERIYIPGFRGVNHMPGRFSDECRRLLRQRRVQTAKRETAYFSEAVMRTHFDFYRNVERLAEMYDSQSELYQSLKTTSEELQTQLLKIQQVEHVLIRGLSEGKGRDKRLFGNLLDAMQHIYTNGIIRFQRVLALMRNDLNIDFYLPNGFNPFVSESENPHHAYRYALGLKNPYERAALKPRYHDDGRPSYPYVGEIHITLREVSSLTKRSERRLLVRERMAKAALIPGYSIGPELEATALSHLPEGQVVHSEVVRLPNFAVGYRREFAWKYGFTEEMYGLFRKKIVESPQGSEKRAQAVEGLCQWLCAFQTARMIYIANALSLSMSGRLAFLDSHHGLTDTLPTPERVNRETNVLRIALADKLFSKRKLKSGPKPFFSPHITTSKDAKFFAITEHEIRETAQELGWSAEDINQILNADEILRTPPTQNSEPRTPIKSTQRRSPDDSPYQYGDLFERYHSPLSTNSLSEDDSLYTDDDINRLLSQVPLRAGDMLLAAIDGTRDEGGHIAENIDERILQQVLQESQGENSPSRLAIPVNTERRHWVALLIEFNNSDRTAPRIKYIDPLGGVIPQSLLSALQRVFPNLIPPFPTAQLQDDDYNCGPWVVEIIKAYLTEQGLPTAELDIQQARASHREQFEQMDELGAETAARRVDFT